MTGDVALLYQDDPIPCMRPDYDPMKDYEAELIYRHEMYPREIPERITLKSALGSVVSTSRNILGGLKEARDTLYGYDGKGGLGIHLKPVEEMEFLPGGYGSRDTAIESTRLDPTPIDFSLNGYPKDPKVIVKEIHHYHAKEKKKGSKTVVKKDKETKSDADRFMDPDYIPDSMKGLFGR